MGKWRDISEIVCDKRMPIMLTAAVYKTVIRPVLMYGCETWALRKGAKRGSKNMRISRWMTYIKRIEKV